MTKTSRSLTASEKKIIKTLLLKRWRNQDIQAVINQNRKYTINSARITEVKKDNSIQPASDSEIDFFHIKNNSFDPKTGLNNFDDERLIRAREAMILAVKIFNDPLICFKTEVFAVLSNIAWTYLLHEYYHKNGVNIIKKDGHSLLLSGMLKRHDCPLSKDIINNITSIKLLRDEVEHTLLGRADLKWLSLFQACCLNFNQSLCSLFDEKLSLSNELSFSLQFSKINFENASLLNKYEIPPYIEGIDARIKKNMTEDELSSLEYQFKVIYTLDSASKSKSNIEFIHPSSNTGKAVHNVLVQHKPSDILYPHQVKDVVSLVRKKTGRKFSVYNHTQAWKKFQVRPIGKNKEKSKTNKEFCIYHSLHDFYSYSDKWVNFLIENIKDDSLYNEIISFK